MRIIKNNTNSYQEFYKLLPYLSISGQSSGLRKSYPAVTVENSDTRFFNEIYTFTEKVNKADNARDIEKLLMDVISRIIPVSGVTLFYNKEASYCMVAPGDASPASEILENAQKEGVLDWIIEAKNCRTIPDLKTTRLSGTKIFYLLVPVMMKPDVRGLAAISTTVPYLTETSAEAKTIQVLVSSAFLRAELIRKEIELNEAYRDHQVYQSKLINNHKLSAIGELTNGIAEEILSPLQVLITEVDLLKKEKTRITEKESVKMIKQIKKIESVISRLVKFASLKSDTLKLHPCDINAQINEYHDMLEKNLAANGFESILDLSESLPPVVSHPNYINQILTNVFNIINSSSSGGGIIIQTRYIGDKITVRFIVTDILNSKESLKDSFNVNLKIIENLMKKHEGECKIGANRAKGAALVLTFPLKRRIR